MLKFDGYNFTRLDRSANPKGEGKEVDREPKDAEGGGVKNPPVGAQAEGDVAKLDDLIEGEGKRNKGGREQRERESEGGHGEKEYVSEENEDVMERNDAFPAEAGEEGNASEFSILRKGLKVRHDKIGEGEKGKRNCDPEETMCASRLKDERNGRVDIREMDGKEEFAETAIDESKRRDGVSEEDRQGKGKEVESGAGKLAAGK